MGYFAYAQYDVRSPIGTSCHFPRRRKQIIVFARKRSDEANSREGGGLRSIFSVLFQGDCRGTSCLAMTYFFTRHSERSEESHRRTDGAYTLSLWSWDISLALNMTERKIDISLSLNMTVAVKSFFFFKLRYADHVRNGHRKRYSVSGGF